MTKPQEKPGASWKVTKAKKPTYVTLYLVLLILLTISSVFGLFQLGNIDTTLASLHTQPILGYINLAQHALAVVMAVGLIYLYKKQKAGLLLILSGYGAAVIFSIVFLFFKEPLVEDITRQVVSSENSNITPEFARQVASTVLTVAPILNAVMSILFGTLWYFAWQKQAAFDATDKEQ